MKAKPKILDLYACAGGAGMGYARAGFHVVGADLKPSPRNPHVCLEADALGLTVKFLRMFDAIHASPPCQGLTDMNNDKSRHTNLIPATRDLLEASGRPYIIENVRRARPHMINPVSLFGTMFGLRCTTSAGATFVLSRERLFETNWGLTAPADYAPAYPIANVIGGHIRARSGAYRTGKGTGKTVDFPGEDRPALAAQLMGIDWMTMAELSEAIPPAYTEWVGARLLEHL